MPYDGSGNFVRVHNWTVDAANGLDINATEMDAEDTGFATGLTNAVTRDGQGKMQVSFFPNVTTTLDLGSASLQWRNGFLSGTFNVGILNATTIIGNIISTGIAYPQTPAESAAGVIPTSSNYAPEPIMDSRRQGGVNDPSIQAAINASTGTNETIGIVATTPLYDAGVSWKGRPHQTTGLPFRINNITWSGAQLTAQGAVFDKYLYVCEYVNNRIGVLSIEDPRNPRYLRSFSTGAASTPRHIEVQGRYLFVANFGINTITVYDLSNPSSASLVGTITTGTGPKQFVIVGNDIFCCCYNANTIEQYRFYLPTNGVTGFSATTLAVTNVPNGPICCSYNGAGILAVVGIDTAGVALLGTETLNLITNTSVGGQHPACSWASKSQLLVTDQTSGLLVSMDCESLTAVQTSAIATTSATPSSIEIVGSRCYVSNLTLAGVAGSIDCFDLTDVRNPVAYKNVPCLGNGTGFTAFYSDDRSAFIYATCHFSPYGMDIIEVPVAAFPNRPNKNFKEVVAARNGRFSTLNAQQQISSVVTIPYTATMIPDASQGNVFVITVSNTTACAISNPINCAKYQKLVFMIRNTSGGVIVLSWAGNFKLSTYTQPANGFSGSKEFLYDGTNWVQCGGTYADVPN